VVIDLLNLTTASTITVGAGQTEEYNASWGGNKVMASRLLEAILAAL